MKESLSDREEREIAEAEARGQIEGAQRAAARILEALPHPEAPPFLAERVMARIMAEPAPATMAGRLRDLFFGARWSPAAALATAALVGGALFIAGTRFASAPEPVALAPAPVAPMVIPASSGVREAARRPARFVLHAPGAKEVRLAGEFTGWKPSVRLHDRGGGLWEATLMLPAGRHVYMFVVDDTWTTDPLAPAFRDDGFGSRNAVLEL